MNVFIEPEVLNEIHSIGEKDFPNESCGFVFGKRLEEQIHITLIQEVANNDENKKVHYTIPPKEFMKAEHYALDQGLDLVGVFHSHPEHPPKPSGRDLDDALPEISYLITSVSKGQALDTRSWRLNDERIFVEEPIDILFKNKLSKSNTQHG